MRHYNHRRFASWVIGGVSAAFLVGVFAFAPAELPEFKHKILGFIVAACAAFLAYFLSGTVSIDGIAALKPIGKLKIKAGGSAAIFILVLIWWNSDQSVSKVAKQLEMFGGQLEV